MKFKFIIAFIIAFCLFDNMFGLFMNKTFYNIEKGLYGKINIPINNKFDILIIGSSRAGHHYNSTIIEKKLNKQVFNSGIGGQGFYYYYALAKEVLNRKNCNVIVIDIAANIITDLNTLEKTSFLVPYCDFSESFNEILKLNNPYIDLLTIINTIKFNSTLYSMFRGVQWLESTEGYIPLSGEIDTNNVDVYEYKGGQIDSLQFKYYAKTLELCKKSKIRVISIVSPTYIKFDRSNEIISHFQYIADTCNTKFYDLSKFDQVYHNTTYFVDQLHMNSEGTDIFSEYIASNYLTGQKSIE